MRTIRYADRQRRRAMLRTWRKQRRRLLAAAAVGSTLLMSGHADADIVIPPAPDEVLTAQEGDFFMAARNGELIDWTQDITSGQGYGFDSLSHLFEQSFFFRTNTEGFEAAEHRLGELTLTDLGQVNPATSQFEGDSAFFSFGGQAGEPIQVDLEYELAGTFDDPPMSSITKRLNITNTSGGDMQLAWFLYMDLDLEGNPAGDLGQLFSANTIRQTSSIGSFVDTRVAAGDNPSAFSIEPFADIIDELDDGQLTPTLANQSLAGPGDVTHGFLWNFSLGAGESEQLEIVTEGTFTPVVAPDFQSSDDPDDPTPSFNFDVPDPPIIGDRPIWYDPAVSIGYDYAIEDFGNNAFAEVYLPFFGDGEYTLIILDEDHPLFGEEIIVDAADVSGEDPIPSFDLTWIDEFDDLRGARAFQILGIEPFVEIDPEDPTGFPTGLTFIDSDFTSFSQTAIIPEPTGFLLVGLAGAGLVLRRGRRRR